MKNLSKFIPLILVIIAFFFITAPSEKHELFEGDINPYEIIEKWTKHGEDFCPQLDICVRTYKNPSSKEPLYVQTFVLLKLSPDRSYSGTIVAYRYFIGIEPFVFLWDIEKEKYMKFDMDDNYRKTCIGCHAQSHPEFKKLLPKEESGENEDDEDTRRAT
jgi:hypothetical protein